MVKMSHYDRMKLIGKYAEAVVDSMDLGQLTDMCLESVTDSFEQETDEDVIMTIEEDYPQLTTDIKT